MTLSPAKQALASYWTQHHNTQAQRFGISPIAKTDANAHKPPPCT